LCGVKEGDMFSEIGAAATILTAIQNPVITLTWTENYSGEHHSKYGYLPLYTAVIELHCDVHFPSFVLRYPDISEIVFLV